MKKFVVSEYSYEYNDEGYNRSEGGIPVGIFDTMEEAEVFMKKATLEKVTDNPGVVVNGETTLYGARVDDFITLFGPDGISSVSEHRGEKYAYAYFDDINTSDWDDEKTKKFIEFFDIETHFVTEVQV